MDLPEYPVLIVGGGTVGLSMALFLARQGVVAQLVERHAAISIHPRVVGPGVRTMELFRLAGIEDEIRRVAPLAHIGGATSITTLVEADLAHQTPSDPAQVTDDAERFSPTNYIHCPQDVLDPILVDAAQRGGASICFNTEVVGIEQDGSGVTVQVVENGVQSSLRARYVIAADGSSSFIRRRLGIGTSGPGALGSHIMNILFEADLGVLVGEHPFIIAEVKNDRMHGMFVRIRDNRRWVLHISYDPANGESPADFTPERCRELIYAAIGANDVPVEILGILPWQVAGSLADRFRGGRVFLIGDAAHVVPPTGGYGMNTGIADAHNLAWKLALVLRGQADDALLSSYDAERRPAANFALEQSLLRLRNAELHFDRSRVAERIERGIANPLVVHLGDRYVSRAIIDPNPERPSLEEIELDLDGSPGTRLPHAWVERQGERCSTLDLSDSRFTLFAGPAGDAWCAAAQCVAERRNLDFASYRLDHDFADPAGALRSALGIGESGALLVRPDGVIAWRSTESGHDPETIVQRVLEQILGW
ncbi:MAG TPA: FAD-dependent oxidoreductase [Nitrolancea sp.]|nr:FAD-dependent oxidoreductase [Nitrolancea sp.]